jgi:hypothetical protein
VDNIRCAYIEDACKKENANSEHRADSEANHERDTAKSVQSRIVSQLACLKPGTEFVAVGPHSRLSATGAAAINFAKLPDLLLLAYAEVSLMECLTSLPAMATRASVSALP